MPWAHAAVAAHVQIPALVSGDHADVLALRLGTFAGAAGHGELELVRAAQAFVAVLQAQGHADTVLHAVTAPGAAHARFHRAGRFAVGVAGFEAGFDQLAPDQRKFMQLGTEQVDALAAGDFGVQIVLLGHLANDDELVGVISPGMRGTTE